MSFFIFCLGEILKLEQPKYLGHSNRYYLRDGLTVYSDEGVDKNRVCLRKMQGVDDPKSNLQILYNETYSLIQVNYF